MSAEYFPEETVQAWQPLGAEDDMFARIEQLTHDLGVTSAGAYFSKNLPSAGGSAQMLAMTRETDDTLFFACNHTASLAYDAGGRRRTMDAFLVDLNRKELAYLTPAYISYDLQGNERDSQGDQGPLIIDTEGTVGISFWRSPQLELQPNASSPQPSRLEYEKSPTIYRAGQLASRLRSFDPSHRRKRVIFPVGV